MTTEPKWTPGPWHVQAKIDIWIMAGSLHVATIPRAADGDWSPHNARLIAQAPAMAEKLSDALTFLEHSALANLGDWDRWAESVRTILAEFSGEHLKPEDV